MRDARLMQPTNIIRNLLHIHKTKYTYCLLCGVINNYYYIVVLKKDILTGHCTAAAILNSFKLETLSEV